jgi:hypothetical protein
MGITVDTDALAQAASGYQDTAAAVQNLHGGLSSALDQVAAAAANEQISAGTAKLHSGLTTALRALVDSSNQYATKVTQAAATYRAADQLTTEDSAAPAAARGMQLAAAAPADRNLLKSFGTGFFEDGLVRTVKDLGNLVGFGGWEGLQHSWGANLKLGLALNKEIRFLNDAIDLPGLPKGTLTRTLVDTGKGLVAWDQWKEDPARAAGNVVFNGVSILYGPKVIGAAVKGVSTGLKGAAVGAEAAAETASVETAAAGEAAAGEAAAARAAARAAETQRLAEVERLTAEQAADQAAQARGETGIGPTAEKSLDPWRPEPKPEPDRISQLDNYRTAEDVKLDKLENMDRGNDFNRWRGDQYPANEVVLENGKRLDGYDPGKEIVSRKSTQITDVATGEKAVHEVLDKYSPGNVVADTPANRTNYPDLVGKPIKGDMILEVPVQNQPVPAEFGAWAKRLGVTIRDPNGTVYN